MVTTRVRSRGSTTAARASIAAATSASVAAVLDVERRPAPWGQRGGERSAERQVVGRAPEPAVDHDGDGWWAVGPEWDRQLGELGRVGAVAHLAHLSHRAIVAGGRDRARIARAGAAAAQHQCAGRRDRGGDEAAAVDHGSSLAVDRVCPTDPLRAVSPPTIAG